MENQKQPIQEGNKESAILVNTCKCNLDYFQAVTAFFIGYCPNCLTAEPRVQSRSETGMGYENN